MTNNNIVQKLWNLCDAIWIGSLVNQQTNFPSMTRSLQVA